VFREEMWPDFTRAAFEQALARRRLRQLDPVEIDHKHDPKSEITASRSAYTVR
jgi:hypothetical protein